MRVTGSSHSSSDISDTDGLIISTEELKEIHIDTVSSKITIGAGVTYEELINELADAGRALV